MDPGLRVDVHELKLSPSEGMENTVMLAFKTITQEIHQDPATGIQTLVDSILDPSPRIIHFSIDSTSHSHICDHLHRLKNCRSLSESLAPLIASAANDSGFGINGFVLMLVLTRTLPRESPVLQRLVCQGTIDGDEELEKLNMETEPCSICLGSLARWKTSVVPTRMPCSHVFHDRCLLKWISNRFKFQGEDLE
ncbi:unnamed protein product [Thlaspi arvense]|uniref:RING-type domain-containing protein n=1 Tax=Thlaspi arvense TaxID=13288 RepID=A0AAU9RCJ6_THLAR|nr:unnamed protein product [Thlaspi arvense]